MRMAWHIIRNETHVNRERERELNIDIAQNVPTAQAKSHAYYIHV